jgi:chemotaxis protein methyltransferase CheR
MAVLSGLGACVGGDEEELVHMVDEVTTNTTDFFREPQHFEYLAYGCSPS